MVGRSVGRDFFLFGDLCRGQLWQICALFFPPLLVCHLHPSFLFPACYVVATQNPEPRSMIRFPPSTLHCGSCLAALSRDDFSPFLPSSNSCPEIPGRGIVWRFKRQTPSFLRRISVYIGNPIWVMSFLRPILSYVKMTQTQAKPSTPNNTQGEIAAYSDHFFYTPFQQGKMLKFRGLLL